MKEKMFGFFTQSFWSFYCQRMINHDYRTAEAAERLHMNIKEQIAVMQHYAAGGKVQWRPAGAPDACWKDYTQGKPLWNWMDTEYRIKPKEPRVIYCIEFDDGTLAMLMSKDSAPHIKSIKFVEVLP